ncbi:hypothetical protein [Novosphingobium lindaniclasticum]|uniref:Uncharacterized protein n=1 Tax=Novosphingobium lindaniclasticum LE124 TaxID=1096930 RepID=T0J7A1_9SPHN|nr:hypothetical protein [Novosphingobium lindaniclasticum]EQB17804.1 hypothetical protein L284_06390 [Novosphingobium lindaniclasticum LE124]
MYADELQQELLALDTVLQDREVNRNERATILIAECLGSGPILGPEILDRLHQLGFDRRHVGIRLERDKGGPWRRTDDGHYHLNP